MRDLRELDEIPARLQNAFECWRNASFAWSKWERPHDDWTHDHCESCFACICDHRERFPNLKQAHEERGCYRHAYYAERRNEQEKTVYLWVCRNCFKRLKDSFGWTVSP